MSPDPTNPTEPLTGESILIVDDDPVFRERLARGFRRRGFDVRTAGGYASAIAQARADSPEKAVVDLKMPEHTGLEVLRELKEIDPTTSVVVLTGYGSIATAIDAVRLGATHYVQKPADIDELLAAFERGERPPLEGVADDTPYETPSLERKEWEYIQQILADCDGNVSLAARRLGVHRRTLQRKLQRYPPRR